VQRSVLDRDNHGRLIRVPFRVDGDFAGYTRKILGIGNRVAQLLGICPPGSFDRIGQQINGIVTKGRECIGSLVIIFLFVLSDELLNGW